MVDLLALPHLGIKGPAPRALQGLPRGAGLSDLFSWDHTPARNRPLALPIGTRRPSVKVRHPGRENE